jgi:hypothetical protein
MQFNLPPCRPTIYIGWMRKAVLALLILFSLGALAQNPNDHNRYLLPVIGRDLPGVNGSIWTAEWTVHNFANSAADLIFSPGESVAPRTVARPIVNPRGDGSDGAYVYVPKNVDDRVAMSLRVRDLSKNATSFGTEIPIVADDDYTSGERPDLFLLDIPTDPRFRATLRLYGASEAPQRVLVTVYADLSAAPVEQSMVELQGIIHVVPEPFPKHPAYAQLDPLSPAARAAGERVHIVLHSASFDSLVSPPPIIPTWGFITITDNETQQVTTITPQRK